jgi:PAS domain S-box-containing protein
MRSDPFRRQVLALFFIVSVVPALVVGAVWYVYTQTSQLNFLFLDFKSFVLPVILVGLIPALVLSYAFAELLARPVRRIHRAVLDLSSGDFTPKFRESSAAEFEEIGQALDLVAARLQQTLSRDASETALIEAERSKLRTVLNSMTDGVFALDRSGRIILFNKAASELTGRSIEEVAGQLAEKVMPFRANGQLVMTRWLATHPGTTRKVGEWRGLELYDASGRSLYVDVQAMMLKSDPNGIAALVTFHDLTETRQLEEMKIDFVALAAHELRTPLTEIKGYLDILEHEAKGLTKANHEFLERGIASAARLSGLVHNLLNVSRIEHGELGFSPEAINFHDFLTDIATEMRTSAESQHRTLVAHIPAKLPTVIADNTAIREVVINLIDNAIKNTASETGKIELSAGFKSGEIEVSVKDNGAGIPEEAIPHLFTKFFRVSEMKSTTSGTGLGLYICKSILDAHGGAIWVESKLGSGSTFSFRLPLSPVAAAAHTRDNTATSTSTISRGAHGWIKDHPVR